MDSHAAVVRLTGTAPGTDLAIAVHDGVGIGLARRHEGTTEHFVVDGDEIHDLVADIEARIAPRWIWWDRSTTDFFARHGLRIARCWDVTVTQQLLVGGPRRSPAHVWADLHGLPTTALPEPGQLDLGQLDLGQLDLGQLDLGQLDLGQLDDGRATVDGAVHDDLPVRPDGHLDPDRFDHPAHLAARASLALRAAALQRDLVDRSPSPGRILSAAHAESACELLCAELGVTGLPIDEPTARELVTERIGPRPTDQAHERRLRDERDARVLDLVAPSPRFDLRNPSDVRSMLNWVGLDLPDTRMWRLEEHRDHHPVVAALLDWRGAERIATTFGHRWLDEHVVAGRLHGQWASSDGAAGRMTATAGLHNMPAELRPAVYAGVGHRFVRADLGQVEPRVLAAVSGDRALVAATASDDLYLPIAERLGVDRPTAKLAVLGAMYGATTGNSAGALRALAENFPTAVGYLERAAEIGRTGGRLATVGGRRIGLRPPADRSGAAAQGRFARNAVVQGAAAEFFKVWAAIVRARCRASDARIVLCLHDELILHVPTEGAEPAMTVVIDSLDEAAHRWSPHAGVRFVADIGIAERWSDFE